MAKGQVNINALTLSYANDSIHLKTELASDRDTSFFHQLLICSGRQYAALVLIQDTIHLRKKESVTLFHSVSKTRIIDTAIYYTLIVSGYSKQKKFTGYSSLQPGLPIAAASTIPEELPRNCGIVKSDSGIYLLNPYHLNINNDSIDLQIHGLTQNLVTLEYPLPNSSCLNVENELLHMKKPGSELAWLSIHSGGHQLCRSQNFKRPAKPVYDSLTIKSPNLQHYESELGQFDKDRYKSLKKSFLPPLISGSLTSESNFQNYRYPLTQRDPDYSRLYLNATLTPFGIPFDINALVTTEHHSGRKLNYFNVSFDQKKWEENRAKRVAFLEQYAEGKKSELLNSQRKLENQLYSEKQRLESLTQPSNPLKVPEIPDSLNHFKDTMEIPELNYDVPQYDSSNLFDSLTNIHNPYDSSLAAHRDSIAALQARIESLSNKLAQIKELQQKLGLLQGKIARFREMKNPLNDFKKLEAGDIYPHFDPITLEGVQVRGINTSYQYKDLNAEVFIGKTMVPRKTFFADSAFRQELSRNAAGLKLEYAGFKKQKLALSFLHFSDTKNLSAINFQGHIKNTVLGIHHQVEVGKKLKIETNAAFSDLNYLSVADTFELGRTTPVRSTDWLNNSALEITANWSEKKDGVELETGIKRVGPQYYSAGVPFLRTDYSEWTIKAKKSLLSNRIFTSVNYSLNTNDLNGINGYRTQLQGFGFQLNTRFKNSPNIFLSYLPFRSISEYRPNEFQADPASPSPVYRNVIQNRVLLVMATYQKRIFSQDLDFAANYTRSAINIDEVSTEVQMFGINATGASGSKVKYGLKTCINYQSEVSTDSNSQSLHSAFLEYTFRRFKLMNGFEYASIGSARKFIGQNVRLTTTLLGIKISSELIIGWKNSNYYPSTNKHTVQCYTQLSYQF